MVHERDGPIRVDAGTALVGAENSTRCPICQGHCLPVLRTAVVTGSARWDGCRRHQGSGWLTAPTEGSSP
jgi:hypothetical protein